MNVKNSLLFVAIFSLISTPLWCMQESYSDKEYLLQKIAECTQEWQPFCETLSPSYDQIKNVILPILHINTHPLVKKKVNYKQININSIIENQPKNPTRNSEQLNIQKLLEILTYGYDINYDKGRPLAIEYAATKQLDRLCRYLLSCGSKLPQTTKLHLHQAACTGLLTQCKENANVQKIERSLYHLKKYNLILPNFKDQAGNTSLHYAILNGNEKTACALLNAGASTQIRNANGKTPLHLAIEIGNIKLITLLVKHNAYIQARD